MKQSLLWFMLIIALALTGCGGAALPIAQATEEPTAEPDDLIPDAMPTTEGVTAEEQATDDALQFGLVAGPVDDGGFNQLAWEGLQQAADEYGAEAVHQDSTADTFENDINALIVQDVDIIVTVGFGLAEATRNASLANPSIPFVSVDFPGQTSSDLGLLFSTDEPAFMAGYLAAGMSETGTVCTFGGTQIPPVLIFLVGFESGVNYYNAQNDAEVELLGWETDVANQLGGEGLFIDSFTDIDAGRAAAEELFAEDCDVIFPVAGGSSIGAAEAAQAADLMVIGVDADQTETEPQLADVFLTSVLKRVDVAVLEGIRQIQDDTLLAGTNIRSNYIGTLENDGVGLAPFRADVPDDLQAEIEAIEAMLIAGELSTLWPLDPPDDGLTREMIASATYQLADGETVTLTGGSANGVTLSEFAAFGDLDGDGVVDGAAILTRDDGASELAVLIEQGGDASNVATVALGEGLELDRLAIEGGEIVVTLADGETRRFALEITLSEVTP